jgi:transcriptional regulator
VAIHAYGLARTFEGPERLRPHLAAMTAHFERPREEPWSVDDAPPDYVEAMCRGIVGVEIRLTRIEGKWKLSQNRPAADRRGVARGLRERGGDVDRALADGVERAGRE